MRVSSEDSRFQIGVINQDYVFKRNVQFRNVISNQLGDVDYGLKFGFQVRLRISNDSIVSNEGLQKELGFRSRVSGDY